MGTGWDVVVVGSGNAGISAALAARERGRRVLVVDKAPREWLGGNGFFTGGVMRTTFSSLDDVIPLLYEPDRARLSRTNLPAYGVDDFVADMLRTTRGRTDRELMTVLARESADVIAWLRSKGHRFELLYERQSYEANGWDNFFGGVAVGAIGYGGGLIERHLAASAAGVEIQPDTPVTGLLRDGANAVTGVRTSRGTIHAGAVVLAAGGFEANPRLRAQYLGPNWDLARVRGTPYNTGEVLLHTLAEGAQAYGHWSGCHSVFWDAGSPLTGDRLRSRSYARDSYPLGITVNTEGRRFVDEGADFRNYTYAKYGAEVLRQPGAQAFQIYDAKLYPMLQQDQYAASHITKVEADSIEELATRIDVDPAVLVATVEEFNAACVDGPFNPAVKDGKRAAGITPPKSHWALPIAHAPFYAYPVTCGITFTFGGLRINPEAQVLDAGGRPIPGLHAAGEMVGGLFYHNYPGGSGLMAGATFGRRAGWSAAAYAA
jgi:tricarballylate dehydrogenase